MQRFARSVKNALLGIRALVKHERNFQIQLAVFLLVILMGVYFSITRFEWVVIILVSALVFALEAMNTSIEHLANFIHPEKNDKIGLLKDIAAGSVLMASISALIIGVIVFYDYVIQLF